MDQLLLMKILRERLQIRQLTCKNICNIISFLQLQLQPTPELDTIIRLLNITLRSVSKSKYDIPSYTATIRKEENHYFFDSGPKQIHSYSFMV